MRNSESELHSIPDTISSDVNVATLLSWVVSKTVIVLAFEIAMNSDDGENSTMLLC